MTRVPVLMDLRGPHVCTASTLSPQLAQEPRFKKKKKHQYATKTLGSELERKGKGGGKSNKEGRK